MQEWRNGNRRMWSQYRINISQNLRNRRQIEESDVKSKTEYNGPINYYKRRLNDLLRIESDAKKQDGQGDEELGETDISRTSHDSEESQPRR